MDELFVGGFDPQVEPYDGPYNEPPCNRHYIAVDEQGRIVDGWSDGPYPERDTATAVCINGQWGYQFRLFPGGEENPPLYTMDGVPLYYWDGTNVIPRTEEEINADRTAMYGTSPVEEG